MIQLPDSRCLLVVLPWVCGAPLAHAVIVAGTMGTGNNNDTQAGLDGHLVAAAQSPFPYWQNLVRVTDASGVYLGFNPNTSRGWVLSANHVTPPTSITVAGNPYSVANGIQIGTSDLKLYEIGGGISDPALPSLASVPLASAFASTDQFSLMFGRGFTNSNTAPYPWVAPGTSDSNGMRWGTNTVLGYGLVNGNWHIVVDFTDPSATGVTAYEAQAVLGDSGGGLFIFRGGQWELSGIAHFVDDGPDFLEPQNAPTGDNQVDPSQYGDFSAYTDVHWHLATLQNLTGPLVPEPRSALLLLAGLGLWSGRRSR
jgi:hypothetical protein